MKPKFGMTIGSMVVMFIIIMALLLFAFGVGRCADVSLAWDAPTTRVDGTALTAAEIQGYTVYWGTQSGAWTGSVSVVETAATVACDPGFTYFFVVTAMDTGGLESGYSNEVGVYVPLAAPGAPVNLRIQ